MVVGSFSNTPCAGVAMQKKLHQTQRAEKHIGRRQRRRASGVGVQPQGGRFAGASKCKLEQRLCVKGHANGVARTAIVEFCGVQSMILPCGMLDTPMKRV